MGKTTMISEMSGVLRAANIPHAAVDFDQLTASFPRAVNDDRWGTKLGLANLAAVWRNFHAAGAERLLIALVIETRSELQGYEAAVPGAEIAVVRLRASVETLQARLRRRGQGLGLDWHLQRATQLAPQMDASRVEDLLVETEQREPTELAREILVQLGWLHAKG